MRHILLRARFESMAALLLALSLTAACTDPDPDPGEGDADLGQVEPDLAGEMQDMSTTQEDMGADLGASDMPGAPDANADMAIDMAMEEDPIPDPSIYEPCAPYAVRGAFAVGVTTLMLDGVPVEVWYPAQEAGEARDVYDLRDWLPPDFQEKISPDEPTTFTTDAYRDVAIAEGGPWPLALFSHGFAGYRLQSTALMTHLASWGYVVASTEHKERWLQAVLANELDDINNGNNAQVLGGVADLMSAEAERVGGRFEGKIDLEHIAVVGHSAGGAAAIQVSGNERYDVIVGYTPAVKSFEGDLAGDAGVEGISISGTNDRLTLARDIEAWATQQPLDHPYIAIEKAGHLAPTDICLIGRERGGVIEIAEDAGLDVPVLIKVLAKDGCRASDLPPEASWPIFGHFTVARLRASFGQDEDGSRALGAEAVGCFGEFVKTSSIGE